MADNLKDILEIARRETSDIPDEVWARIEGLIRLNFGGQRPYIAAQKKRRNLEAIAQADADASAAQVAEVLGLTVRRVQQLRRLK